MSQCRPYHELIERLLGDDISPADLDFLQRHCETCHECADLVALHDQLVATGSEIPVPDSLNWHTMRETVLASTTSSRFSPKKNGFLVDIRRLWSNHPLPSGLVTAALLVFAAFWGQRGTSDQPQDNGWLQAMIPPAAAQQSSLDSFWNSTFSFSNVSVRPTSAGKLNLSFDACRHLDVEVAQESALAKEVLLHAIMEPASLGSRIKAMEVTPSINDRRLKDALIYTQLNDGDSAVRLNALAVLARYPYDAASQNALLQTLARDPDVQMRISAMEELVRRDVGKGTIDNILSEEYSPKTQAILRPAAVRH